MTTTERNDKNAIEERNVIIIGGGTAGFAAGVYTSRAMLEPLLITGDALGGQLSLTLDLENYPGFFGTEAADFIQGLQQQAERFGTEVRFDMVSEVDFNRHPFYVKTYDKEYLAKSVIICTGASRASLRYRVKRSSVDEVCRIARRVTVSFSRISDSLSWVGAMPLLRRAYF